MKRIVIMLLIACSAITTISAESLDNDQKKGKVDTTPYYVKSLFYEIIKNFGDISEQYYSVYKNPETNQIESSVKITNFSSSLTMQGTRLHIPGIAESFMKDEPKSYQMLHLTPGNTEMFILKVVCENGQGSGQYRIRTKSEQEMWLMCCKNPQNPKLRDAYAITWVLSENKSKATGTVYQITSLRPDVYEKTMIGDNSIFRIDGRVGDDLKDSLYVFYVADNAEELNDIADDAFVSTMPVVNKRFTLNIALDKPKVGRIRTVMPDGSLCKLWTNIDIVPGETYRITTHNGWYEEDGDYENRVGRRSGKSLLNDPQRRGIDDQSVEVIDSIPEEFRTVENDVNKWLESLPANQKMQMELKGALVEKKIELIESTYENAAQGIKGGIERFGRIPGFDGTIDIDFNYERIYKQNKELDKMYEELIKLLKDKGMPAIEMPKVYKRILECYAEQNKSLTELMTAGATQTKQAKKTQKLINDLTEKYIKEMEKSLE